MSQSDLTVSSPNTSNIDESNQEISPSSEQWAGEVVPMAKNSPASDSQPMSHSASLETAIQEIDPQESEKSEGPAKSIAIMEKIWTVGGLGHMPLAPGTFGTLAGIPIYFLLVWAGWKAYLISYLFIFLLGWFLSIKAQNYYQKHDDQRVVIDELFGYLTVMFLAPQNKFLPLAFVWGFVIFRFFDIIKPGLIRKVDRIEGGLFVMLDDALAALVACAVMWVCAALIKFYEFPLTPEVF
ncbi:MAG: phosphatidylglycerophosphatase A, partial [Deltaproteobacteria bacterium]|nr:phosphatidylglycerophosphatase A [Deltaproteobacteria bacterium]